MRASVVSRTSPHRSVACGSLCNLYLPGTLNFYRRKEIVNLFHRLPSVTPFALGPLPVYRPDLKAAILLRYHSRLRMVVVRGDRSEPDYLAVLDIDGVEAVLRVGA